MSSSSMLMWWSLEILLYFSRDIGLSKYLYGSQPLSGLPSQERGTLSLYGKHEGTKTFYIRKHEGNKTSTWKIFSCHLENFCSFKTMISIAIGYVINNSSLDENSLKDVLKSKD